VRRTAGLLLVAAALVSGCGAPSADLFDVQRTGRDRNANVRLVVSDGGTVSCNGKQKGLDSERLLTARALARDLDKQAALDLELPPGKGALLRYEVRTPDGTVAFSDTSRGRPRTFDRLVAFTADVAERVCGIER
jgi:hypothetical protein